MYWPRTNLSNGQRLGGNWEVGTLGTESVLIGHVAHGVLDAVRAQVGVAALAHKHVRVANVLEGTLISCGDSVRSQIAQGVLAVFIVHLGVLQDRNVTAIGAGEDGDKAQGQDDELRIRSRS